MPESLLIYKKEKRSFKAFGFLSLLPILLILGLIYGGLIFYEKQLNAKEKGIINDFNELKAKRRINEEVAVRSFDRQLNSLSEILEKLNYGSGFFASLEKIILPKTSLKTVAVNINESSAIIKGYTSNYNELSEQIVAFLTSKDIISEEINGINIDTDGFINFEFKLVFDPGVFK